MNKSNMPLKNDLPSTGKLIRSTILAICIAAIILVTVVLPAEYGLDPLGVGEMIGLTKMGQIKTSLAQEAASEVNTLAEGNTNVPENQSVVADLESTASGTNADSRMEKLTFTLDPNQGKEIKLTMAKGATVNYSWYTDGGKANFDAHADSKALNIKYHNYEKGQLQKNEGIMEAVFDGNHGWFWRNRTSKTMSVTLEVDGSFTAVVQY